MPVGCRELIRSTWLDVYDDFGEPEFNGWKRHCSSAIGPEHAGVVEVHVFHLPLCAFCVHMEEDTNASAEATWHIHLGGAK